MHKCSAVPLGNFTNICGRKVKECLFTHPDQMQALASLTLFLHYPLGFHNPSHKPLGSWTRPENIRFPASHSRQLREITPDQAQVAGHVITCQVFGPLLSWLESNTTQLPWKPSHCRVQHSNCYQSTLHFKQGGFSSPTVCLWYYPWDPSSYLPVVPVQRPLQLFACVPRPTLDCERHCCRG